MWEVENSQAVRNELDLSTLPDVVPSETRAFKCDFMMTGPSFGGVGQDVAQPSILLVLGPGCKASPSTSTVAHLIPDYPSCEAPCVILENVHFFLS